MKVECPDGWRLVKLSDLGEVNRGRSRHRPRHAAHLYGGPYPFIQTADIKASGGSITAYQQTYSEEGLRQSRLWPAGTMCITIAANIAETGILSFPACFPDSVIGFVADDSKCDVLFVEYMFRFLKRHIQYQASESGTVQDNINLGTLESLYFPIPSTVDQQRAIARILGSLDDKIELNRRMNRTLEETAAAIFKSWFVDFDPVAAKAEGRQPFGMDAETAALFPAAFEESDLGPAPGGWKPGTVADLFEVTMGQSPPGTTYNEDGTGTPFFQGRTDFGFRFPTMRVYCTAPTRLARAGETLVSVRAPVGDVNVALEGCAIGRGLAAVRSKDGCRSFTYYTMKSLREAFEVFEGEGTLFGSINSAAFRGIKLPVPDSQVIAAFERLVAPMDRLIENNERESKELATLRDYLLPKLMSGEIRVGRAEGLVEQAP